MNEAGASRPKPVTKPGTVMAVLPDSLFSLRMEDGSSVTAHMAPRMRLHCVRLLEGERVVVELSPFDPGRGRIVRRQ
jgi:translation initiation factor IF-1